MGGGGGGVERKICPDRREFSMTVHTWVIIIPNYGMWMHYGMGDLPNMLKHTNIESLCVRAYG